MKNVVLLSLLLATIIIPVVTTRDRNRSVVRAVAAFVVFCGFYGFAIRFIVPRLL